MRSRDRRRRAAGNRAVIHQLRFRQCAQTLRDVKCSRIYLNGKFTAQITTGVQRVARELVRALDERLVTGGMRWILVCPPGGEAPALKRIEVLRVGNSGGSLHLWEQAALPWVASDGLLLNLSGSAPFFARRQICMIHDAAVFDQPQAYARAFGAWYRLLFRRIARTAELLLTVSEFSRQCLTECLGLQTGRIAVVRPGGNHLDEVQPDPEILDRLGLRGTHFVLAVASENPTKNLPALLAAHATLARARSMRLVIAGGVNDRVFAPAARAEDVDGVIRAGRVSDAQLKALYMAASILVSPSIYEGFGLPSLEAMNCGCPVIASRAAALPESCGDAALYLDPLSVEDIAQTIERALADEDLRTGLRARGYVRAGQLTWSAAADKLLGHLSPWIGGDE